MTTSRRLAVLLTAATLSLGGAVAGAGQAHAADPGIPVGCEGFGNPTDNQITNLVYSRNGRQAGCVVTFHSASFGTQLVRVVVNPGWTYKVKDAGGTAAGTKVAVDFRYPAANDKTSYMIRAGKVVSG